jgi:hypothetical protein
MIIKGVTRAEIIVALQVANESFDGNLMFNRYPEYLGRTRDGKPRFRLTLKVANSRGMGAKLGPTGRHTVNACWHAHGKFFNALPEGTIIEAAGKTFTVGDDWQDWNIGSMLHPMFFSEACECGL